MPVAVNIRLCSSPDNLMKGRDWDSYFENVNLCLFSNTSFFNDSRWEDPILSWQ